MFLYDAVDEVISVLIPSYRPSRIFVAQPVYLIVSNASVNVALSEVRTRSTSEVVANWTIAALSLPSRSLSTKFFDSSTAV